VRAGRMTPEQAANHPSKNVISRALGAESSVEVDMKTIEIEDGTSFLLCTDGITRHISDSELRDLLVSGRPVDQVCADMKQRCYDRGAEDNLTAVIVQVGKPNFASLADAERTVDAYAPELARTAPINVEPQRALTPASRIAFPGPTAEPVQVVNTSAAAPTAKGGGGIRRFFAFIFIIALVAAAFYGGMRYHEIRQAITGTIAPPQATPTPDTRASFQTKRAAVDAAPQQWLAENVPAGSKPLEWKDPEKLYLYGRALLLTGSHKDATDAFNLAIANLRAEHNGPLPLHAEIKLAQAAAALKQNTMPPSPTTASGQQQAAAILDELLGTKGQAAPQQ